MTAPRPKQHLIDAAKRYPGAWRQVDDFRAGKGKDLPDWPGWCFLPLAAAYAIVSQGGVISPHMLADVGRLGALSAWRVTQGIYRFDPALYPAIIDTPIERDLPCEVLYRLPEWCVYIETPELSWRGAALHGFFAHLEHDINTGRPELRLLLDSETALTPLPLHLGNWPLSEAIERMQREAVRQGVAGGLSRVAGDLNQCDLPEQLGGDLAPLISLLLFICSQPDEIGGAERRPANPQPKRTKQGWRLFPAERPTEWDVGLRIGAALRRAYQQAETGHRQIDPETGRASPRAHVRRAHWHGYWKGPRDPERAEERRFDLRWQPPIPVNVTDYDNMHRHGAPGEGMKEVKRNPGRPPLGDESMKRRNVVLSDEDRETAVALGDGNASAGLRLALGRCRERTKARAN